MTQETTTDTTPHCRAGHRLCKPYRTPKPSGKVEYRHEWSCPDKPGEVVHYARENAQRRTWWGIGWRGTP